ncbi:MAG: 1-pyrroline-5-carboxylate dehydrogenase [Phycisphaerae bacterium]|nr:1-pyrroline-5-carboxylate dehydrogenase [Phycisphaerae bacterium]
MKSIQVSAQQIEQRTQQLGREMFERMGGAQPWIFQSDWWYERLMQQCMRNEWLKVQAFRFIDVLPTMGDSQDVARHLKEYFVRNGRSGSGHDGNDHAPAAHATGGHEHESSSTALAELEPDRDDLLVRWVSRAMDFERLDAAWPRLIAWVARKSSYGMAQRFIAGSTPEETARTIRRLRDQRMAFTVDVLGETALSERESEHYQAVYLSLIDNLSRLSRTWPAVPQIDRADGRELPRVNVSVKLTSLYSQFDPIDPETCKRAVKERLRPLLRRGRDAGCHVHVDMEHSAIKRLTLAICRELFMEEEFRDYPHFGLVLQAYLKDCERDVGELLEWVRQRGTPIGVRLVKGAYWDTETVLSRQRGWACPVWEQKWQSDACYERITRTLLANHDLVHTAFGSHNVRSLSHAMALRELWEVPGEAFELQMLYGMGDPIKRAAVDMGQRCRIYTPYGDLLPGMAYLIRRLLENTANESFLAHTESHDVPVEALLRDPEEIGRETPPPEEEPLLRFEFEDVIMPPFENVNDTDFTLDPNRARIIGALEGVRKRYNEVYPLVIDGQRIRTDALRDSLNPSRPAEVVGRVAQADAALAEKAVAAAARAFRTWRGVAPEERAEFLFRVADIMKERRFDLAALMTIECGKPWREADADVSEAIDFCVFYGREMIRMAENVRRRDNAGETNEYFYAPRGVVTAISPWNFPLAILTGMTAAALVTGNTVIMKPAAPAMVIAYRLMEMFEAAGLPKGVLNYLPGPGATVGELLVKHPQVSMVAFTGSREVGCRINRMAAESATSQPALKKVIAEMGGKNAIIVDSDADLDEAIKGVLASAFGYAGQKCSACSRAIVIGPLYERFVQRLVDAARSIRVGPADEPGTMIPPVIDKAAFNAIREYVEVGRGEARCVLESDTDALIRATAGGYYIGPTVFADVPPTARIAREEIFGPVLALLRAASIEAAIEIFNGTDFALTGGIFSRSPAHIALARRECECGNFYINRKITGALVDVQPFGGFKMSGIGSKAGGPDYLIQFCEPRCITENTLRRGFAPSEEVVEAL